MGHKCFFVSTDAHDWKSYCFLQLQRVKEFLLGTSLKGAVGSFLQQKWMDLLIHVREDVLFAGQLVYTLSLSYRLLSDFKKIGPIFAFTYAWSSYQNYNLSNVIGSDTTYKKQSPPITAIATFFSCLRRLKDWSLPRPSFRYWLKILLILTNLWHAVSEVLYPILSA